MLSLQGFMSTRILKTRVEALVKTLKRKAVEAAADGQSSHAVLGRRLLVRRPEDLRIGQELEISVEGESEAVALEVDVTYEGWVLTEPIPEGSVAETFIAREEALASGL